MPALFISGAGRDGTPLANSTAQQERMRTCNAQASKKEMKGDERKKFMSTCLKG